MAITLRDIKKLPLTHEEMDGNFIDLDTRVSELESAIDSDNQTLDFTGTTLSISDGNSVDLSPLLDDTNTFVIASTFDDATGILTLTKNDATTVTVSLDGRYLTGDNLNGTVKDHIVPDTNEVYDLGSSTNRFRDLYLSSSTINLGSTEISVLDNKLQLSGKNIADVIKEKKFQFFTGSTGVVTHDTANNTTFYHRNPSSNFTVNLTNLAREENITIEINIVIDQGEQAYIPNRVQIEGTPYPLIWKNSTPPSGNSYGHDMVTFEVVRRANTYIVIGSFEQIGGAELSYIIYNPTTSTDYAAGYRRESVDLTDNYFAIGDVGPDVVYLHDTHTGQLLHTFDTDEGGFGAAVSINGDKIAISTLNSTINKVRVYSLISYTELYAVELNPGTLNGFGTSVAFTNTHLLVGAFNEQKAHLYDATDGSFIRTFENPNIYSITTASDGFGARVKLTDSYAIIGAPTETDSTGESNDGLIFVYDLTTGDLLYYKSSPLNPNASDDFFYSDRFGEMFEVSNDYLVVGVPNEADDLGNPLPSGYNGVFSEEARIVNQTVVYTDASAYSYITTDATTATVEEVEYIAPDKNGMTEIRAEDVYIPDNYDFDDLSDDISPPWNTEFLGSSYSSVFFNSNGVITFGQQYTSWRVGLFDPYMPKIHILAVDSAQNGLYILTEGIAPNRIHRVWVKTKHNVYEDTSLLYAPIQDVVYEIRFFENQPNRIDVHHETLPTVPNAWERSGIVHVFNIDNGTLLHTIRHPDLFDPDTTIGDDAGGILRESMQTGQFGSYVDISNDKIIVSTPNLNYPETSFVFVEGRAYLYDAFSGKLIKRIDNPGRKSNTAGGDDFGTICKISENYFCVGAEDDDKTNGDNVGSFSVYKINNGSITESQISDLGSYITLSDLSVGSNTPASGSGGLAYNNTTGVFTYTPPDLLSLTVPADDTFDVNLSSSGPSPDTNTMSLNLFGIVTGKDSFVIRTGDTESFNFDSSLQQITYSNSSSRIKFGTVTNEGNGDANDIELFAFGGDDTSGAVYISAGSNPTNNRWKFSNDGNLTAPGNITTTGILNSGALGVTTLTGDITVDAGAAALINLSATGSGIGISSSDGVNINNTGAGTINIGHSTNQTNFAGTVDFSGATVSGLPTTNNSGVVYQLGYSTHDAVGLQDGVFSVNSVDTVISLTATANAQGTRIDISGVTTGTSAGTGPIYIERRINSGSWLTWNAFIVKGADYHFSHSFVDFYDTGGTANDVSAGDTVEYRLSNGTTNTNFASQVSGTVEFELFWGFNFTATEVPLSYSLTQP